MSAEEFRIENNWSNFQELTPTGISPNYNQIEAFAEAYHKSRVEAEIKEMEKSNKGGTHILKQLLKQ